VEGRSLDPLEQRADLGARVEQGGTRLGTVVDVIFDRRLRSLVGYEFVGTMGSVGSSADCLRRLVADLRRG
jgi:uncharacterized protein YrrD